MGIVAMVPTRPEMNHLDCNDALQLDGPFDEAFKLMLEQVWEKESSFADGLVEEDTPFVDTSLGNDNAFYTNNCVLEEIERNEANIANGNDNVEDGLNTVRITKVSQATLFDRAFV